MARNSANTTSKPKMFDTAEAVTWMLSSRFEEWRNNEFYQAHETVRLWNVLPEFSGFNPGVELDTLRAFLKAKGWSCTEDTFISPKNGVRLTVLEDEKGTFLGLDMVTA